MKTQPLGSLRPHGPLTMDVKPARLPEALGMYVDALRQAHPAIEQVWVLQGPDAQTPDARWELLLFADARALEAMRANPAASRDDVDLIVVVDGERLEGASGDPPAARLSELKWRLDGPAAATYRRSPSSRAVAARVR